MEFHQDAQLLGHQPQEPLGHQQQEFILEEDFHQDPNNAEMDFAAEGADLAHAFDSDNEDEGEAGEGELEIDEEDVDELPDGLERGQQVPEARRGPGSVSLLQGEGSGAAMEEDADLIQFTDEEDEDLDVTAEELTASGKDLQGIPWDRLRFSREHYRASRLRQYRNYVNVLPENPEEYRPDILKSCTTCRTGNNFFAFAHNNRTVTTTIVHFQLRNLVWSTSRNDVFVVSQNSVNHWHPMTRAVTEVINLSGGGNKCTRMSDLGKVQVSTLCVRNDLVATGGFGGELVVKRLGQLGWAYAGRISNSENGITNGLEICDHVSHGLCVMAANNDCFVRMFQTGQDFRLAAQWSFPWAVNYTTLQPQGGQLAAVVGDDPETWLTDARTGVTVHKLAAHSDYSFAAAWHPAGHLLATGNQDTTTAVWDVRKTDQPLARLAGRMGAIRALRWSPDGRFLAASEPADFVHIYDMEAGFKECQEIDLFGEISGISFTPAGDCLYVGIADITYASLLAFSRVRDGARFRPTPAATYAGVAAQPTPPQPRFGVVAS